MKAVPLDDAIQVFIAQVEEWERIDSPWLFEKPKPVPPQPVFGKGGKFTGKFKVTGEEAMKQMEIQMGRAATPKGATATNAVLPDRKDGDEALRRRQQDAIHAVLAPLRSTAADMNRKWGTGRLQSLVPEEWALKFHTAAEKLEKAVAATDMAGIRERAEIMRRGWLKLDELATAAGASPWLSADVWEVRGASGNVYAIARRDFDQWSSEQRDGVTMYTLEEVAVILDAWEKETNTSPFKQEFPDSRLTKAQFSPAIDSDDIPF